MRLPVFGTLADARKVVASLLLRIKRLATENAQLRQLVERLKREGKRQASPFSKGKPKKDPRKPGRKAGAGHGPPAFREPPEHVDRRVRVRLPSACPGCGGKVEYDTTQPQYQWEIPRVQPVVTQFDVEIGHCKCCGARVQGRHPEQTSDALGRARCQIGPNALALATHLNKIVGATFAKIAAFFKVAFGLVVAPSTLVRATLRLARKVEPAYVAVKSLVRQSPVVYPDETGWRVGGHKAWLWVFVGVDATLYVVARYRGFSVIDWAIGKNYAGLIGHDGWAPYDQLKRADHQTCLRHLLNRCQELLDVATGNSVIFPRELQALILTAIDLRDRYLAGEVTDAELLAGLGLVTDELEALLAMRLSHPGNVRLAKHVENHKGQMFTFLEHPELLEATNWPAEQAIRPAVIARKISGCNRSWEGARAHGILVSLIRTAMQRHADIIAFLVQALRQPKSPIEELPAFLAAPPPLLPGASPA